jgi:hypothetical protein
MFSAQKSTRIGRSADASRTSCLKDSSVVSKIDMRGAVSSRPLHNKKGSRLLPFLTHSKCLSVSDFKQQDNRDDGADQQ